MGKRFMKTQLALVFLGLLGLGCSSSSDTTNNGGSGGVGATGNGGSGGSSTTSNGGSGGSSTTNVPDSGTADASIVTSDSGTSSVTASVFGAKYKFANNELSGWQQSTDDNTYWTGAGTDLHEIIDGGEDGYTKHGCLLAMFQTMVLPNLATPDDSQNCKVITMDFGTEAHALEMFTAQQQANGLSIAIPQYDLSVAAANSVISGITVYAHIKASYFELQLTGYSDNTTAAQVATQFLDILKAKTN